MKWQRIGIATVVPSVVLCDGHWGYLHVQAQAINHLAGTYRLVS